MKRKVNCLIREISRKGMYTTPDYIPVCIVNRDFGSVENLIESEKDSFTFGNVSYHIGMSSYYNDRHIQYIESLYKDSKLDKAIKYIEKSSNVSNKDEVLSYLYSL